MEKIEMFLGAAGFSVEIVGAEICTKGCGSDIVIKEICTSICGARLVIKNEQTSNGSAVKIFRNEKLIFSGSADYALNNLKAFANFKMGV